MGNAFEAYFQEPNMFGVRAEDNTYSPFQISVAPF